MLKQPGSRPNCKHSKNTNTQTHRPQHNVALSDELAEALTPPAEGGGYDAPARAALLLRLAKAAKRQGLWHLATKKYTQASGWVWSSPFW